MKPKQKIFIATLAVIFITFGINLIGDFVTYHRGVSNQTYFTPWYDDNAWRSPYTTFCLSQYPAKYRVTTNSVGDTWVVKEIVVGKVEFWTVKYKIQKKDLK